MRLNLLKLSKNEQFRHCEMLKQSIFCNYETASIPRSDGAGFRRFIDQIR